MYLLPYISRFPRDPPIRNACVGPCLPVNFPWSLSLASSVLLLFLPTSTTSPLQSCPSHSSSHQPHLLNLSHFPQPTTPKSCLSQLSAMWLRPPTMYASSLLPPPFTFLKLSSTIELPSSLLSSSIAPVQGLLPHLRLGLRAEGHHSQQRRLQGDRQVDSRGCHQRSGMI
jgi:hypothetical protein